MGRWQSNITFSVFQDYLNEMNFIRLNDSYGPETKYNSMIVINALLKNGTQKQVIHRDSDCKKKKKNQN